MTIHTNFVRQMCASDISFVERIHFEGFPHSRSTQLGARFVRKMYYWFLENEPTLAFVAVINEQPVGFITGSMGSYGRKLFRYTFFEIITGFLQHPKLLMNKKMFLSWYIFFQGLLPNYRGSDDSPKVKFIKASVASIAVARNERGKHIGESLMSAFEDAAQKHGASSLELTVEAGNVAARALYESCAWQLVRENVDRSTASYSKMLVAN